MLAVDPLDHIRRYRVVNAISGRVVQQIRLVRLLFRALGLEFLPSTHLLLYLASAHDDDTLGARKKPSSINPKAGPLRGGRLVNRCETRADSDMGSTITGGRRAHGVWLIDGAYAFRACMKPNETSLMIS